MAKFILLFFGGHPKIEERLTHFKQWVDWIEHYKKTGQFLMGAPFTPEGKIIQGPEKKVSDKAMAPDDMGGYVVIQAVNLQEAVDIARTCPIYDVGGWIEVHQSMN